MILQVQQTFNSGLSVQKVEFYDVREILSIPKNTENRLFLEYKYQFCNQKRQEQMLGKITISAFQATSPAFQTSWNWNQAQKKPIR